jgi:Flp pilus assembly protein CpaB
MKFGVVILLILGLVAAACAAVLMGTLDIGTSRAKQPQSLEVAMARVSLPAITVITNKHIDIETLSRNELPPGQLVKPSQIIGRVLAVPVVEGQVLTESCFVPEGAASKLIAQIPYGMRAFTISVSSRAMPDRALLQPGSVVDVLVSYKLSSRDTEGEALSTTMLRGIQVLAISGESIVSNTEDEEEKGTKKSSSRRGALVTLLVDTKQAEALQLAIENGNITLSIRNPLDKDEFDEDPSILNRRKLTPRGSDLPPAVSPSVNRELFIPTEGTNPGQGADSNNLQTGSLENSDNGAIMPTSRPKSGNKFDNGRKPLREITVIRGNKTEVEEFDSEGAEAEKSAKK